MIEFDINKESIKQIIEPKIVEYKLNENHKLNIKLVMDDNEEPIKNENNNHYKKIKWIDGYELTDTEVTVKLPKKK